MLRPTMIAPLLAAFAFFGTPVAALQQAPAADSTANLRVYLDCRRCDFDYVRREVPVVDYVRDRMDADVHVLVTQQQTGSGGQEYTLDFLGARRARRACGYPDLRFATERHRRRGAGRVHAHSRPRPRPVHGLCRQPRRRRPGVQGRQRGKREGPPASDPWNLWVMRTRASVQIEGESQTRSTELSGSFSASRTTEDLKVDSQRPGPVQPRGVQAERRHDPREPAGRGLERHGGVEPGAPLVLGDERVRGGSDASEPVSVRACVPGAGVFHLPLRRVQPPADHVPVSRRCGLLPIHARRRSSGAPPRPGPRRGSRWPPSSANPGET